MILSKDLREGIADLRNLRRNLKAMQKVYPLHKIMRTRNGGREKYYKVCYFRGKRTRSGIRHGSVDFFNILKGMCIDAKLEMIESNVVVLDRAKKDYLEIDPVALTDRMCQKYPRLDRRDIIAAVNELENSGSEPSDWAKAPYRKADFLEDERTQVTSRGLKVRSKSEAAICEILYANDIEFRYEEVLYINGRKLIPDFTIRRKSDGKIFYLEHFGMMDQASYRKKYHDKLDLYELGDIVPWDNLIITFDKDGSIDLNYIEAIVKTVLAA